MATQNSLLTVTIPAGASVSNGVQLKNGRVVGFRMPAAWTAAGLSFDWSADGQTWNPVYDSGTERVRAADVNRYLQESIEPWLGFPWIRIRSGTVAIPVAQVAQAVININTDTY